jgi:hypothetical protein
MREEPDEGRTDDRLPEFEDMCDEAPVSRYQSDVPPDGEDDEACAFRAACSAFMSQGCREGAGAELDEAPGVL